MARLDRHRGMGGMSGVACGCCVVIAALTGMVWAEPGGAADVREPQTDDRIEPTAAEVRLLELVNRARRDPVGEGERLAPAGTNPKFRGLVFEPDWALFRKEMAAMRPAGPLVFDLKLLASARGHSRYMIAHGQGHGQESGKSGFTGRGPISRARAAGYRGGFVGENVFARASDVEHAHAAFVIDWGKDQIQAMRGHRRNLMMRYYTTAGFAVVPHGREVSVTQVFGSIGQGRRVGGVIFVDRNGDGLYDIGEGVADAHVRIGKKTVAAWSSGAYAADLPRSVKRITLVVDGLTLTRGLGKQRGVMKIDWALPTDVQLKRIDQLLDRLAEPDAASGAGAMREAIELEAVSDGLMLDDERRQRVSAAVGPVREQVAALKAAVWTAAARGDEAAFDAACDAMVEQVRGTSLMGWLLDARAYRAQIVGLEAKRRRIERMPASRQSKMWAIVATGLHRAAERMRTAEWSQRTTELVESAAR